MRNCYRLAIAGLVAVGLTASASTLYAGFTNPIVDMAPGYAKEGSRAVNDHTSNPGDVLTIVGFVNGFNDPFLDLDPNDPTKEYTYAYTGFVSAGTTITPAGPLIIYDTSYGPGTLSIYCDPSLDADYANPASFMNGDMILQASITGMTTSTRNLLTSGNQNGNLEFTGGSLFNRVSVASVGLTGIITGGFSVSSSLVPGAQQGQGYFGWSDTKIDVNIPVPVESKTWGEIKSGQE